MTAFRQLLLACSLAAPALIAAQQPAAAPAPKRLTSLVGAVWDSVSDAPLAGATVVVDGASRMGVTDARGMFRVDSVPAGSWRLALYHPMLDTIGLQIATRPVPFGGDSVQHVEIATPSVATLAASWCAPATRRLGPGALIGRVVDAETGEPVVGARASLVYEETEGIAGLATRKLQRVRTASTDEAGRYALCGLPFDMKGALQLEKAAAKTPEIPVELDASGNLLRTVLLAPALVAAGPGDSAGTRARRLRGSATIRGRVAGPDRRPVAGVRVTVEGTGAEATTDANGAFSIGELPAGTWTVLARRVGARPEQQVVSLPARSVKDVSLVLQPVTELAAVVVRDTVARGLQRVGFESRRSGGMGHYIGPDEIAQLRPNRATDVLRTMPGVVLTPDRRGNQMLASTRDGGRGCMEVYVDGSPTMDGGIDIDNQIPAAELAAVEVYTSGNVPAEFTRVGRGTCGAVVVWTKTRARRSK